jgi:ParB family chromosome partitioning protein
MKISLSKITADSTKNARSVLSGIDELALSIKQHGLLQPVIVEESDIDGRYNLVAGFRRFAAVQALGDAEVEAVVIEDGKASTINLVENICRDDISTYDFAVGLDRMSKDGLSGPMIAKFLKTHRTDQKGCSVPNINNLLRLIRNLDPSILSEWQQCHPAATTENLMVIVKAKDQVAAWNLMIGHGGETSEDSEDSDDGTDDKEEREPKRKRRTPAQMALMLDRLAGTKGVTKAQLEIVRSSFDWVMSECETLLGISLNGPE